MTTQIIIRGIKSCLILKLYHKILLSILKKDNFPKKRKHIGLAELTI